VVHVQTTAKRFVLTEYTIGKVRRGSRRHRVIILERNQLSTLFKSPTAVRGYMGRSLTITAAMIFNSVKNGPEFIHFFHNGTYLFNDYISQGTRSE